MPRAAARKSSSTFTDARLAGREATPAALDAAADAKLPIVFCSGAGDLEIATGGPDDHSVVVMRGSGFNVARSIGEALGGRAIAYND